MKHIRSTILCHMPEPGQGSVIGRKEVECQWPNGESIEVLTTFLSELLFLCLTSITLSSQTFKSIYLANGMTKSLIL